MISMSDPRLGQWIQQVENLIDPSWRFIFELKDPADRYYLEDILLPKMFHNAHQAQDGSHDFSCSPHWTEMFNWTSCPLDKIKAVFLLMKPLSPSHLTFRSTGYAFGVEGKGTDSSIWDYRSGVPTVQNFIKMLHVLSHQHNLHMGNNPNGTCSALAPCGSFGHQQQMQQRWRRSFDPTVLSQKGLLFLNAASCGDHHFIWDHYLIWESFAIELLKKLGTMNPGLVVFQMYNNPNMEAFLNRNDIVHKHTYYRDSSHIFYVIRPLFMDLKLSLPGWKHVARFSDKELEDYVKAILETPNRIRQIREVKLKEIQDLRVRSAAARLPAPSTYHMMGSLLDDQIGSLNREQMDLDYVKLTLRMELNYVRSLEILMEYFNDRILP